LHRKGPDRGGIGLGPDRNRNCTRAAKDRRPVCHGPGGEGGQSAIRRGRASLRSAVPLPCKFVPGGRDHHGRRGIALCAGKKGRDLRCNLLGAPEADRSGQLRCHQIHHHRRILGLGGMAHALRGALVDQREGCSDRKRAEGHDDGKGDEHGPHGPLLFLHGTRRAARHRTGRQSTRESASMLTVTAPITAPSTGSLIAIDTCTP